MKSVITLCLALTFLCSSQLWGQKKALKLEKLGSNINSFSYDEISPVVSLDGNTIYFTRVGDPNYNKTLIEDGQDLSKSMTRSQFLLHLQSVYTQIAKRVILDPEQSGFNQDIWIAETSTEDFDKVSHPGYPMNNALPNSVSTLTPNENEVVVINQFIEKGGMQKGFSVIRQHSDESWGFPEPITIEDYYTRSPNVSMTISNDGSVLILSVQRDDSYGLSDFYVSFRKDSKTWSVPKNLGPNINSAGSESTPFLSEDKTKLFFATDGRTTIGGTDIFVADRLDNTWTSWSEPRRFIEPINSTGDDSQPFFNSSTGYLYFTSRRDGTSDIFRVKIASPIPHGVKIKGKILDAKTKKPMSGKVLSNSILLDHYKNAYLSDDGTFEMTIPKGQEFTLIAEKKGYIGKEEKISFKADYVYFKEYEIILYLDRDPFAREDDIELIEDINTISNAEDLKAGSIISLNAIYFKQSEPEVLEESHPALNDLAKFLKSNQGVYIRINGHTDNQGDEHALMKLSERRARAIKDYLVYSKGISPLRVDTKGFGASEPVNNNSTDELRKANRRVEIEIIKISKKRKKKKEE